MRGEMRDPISTEQERIRREEEKKIMDKYEIPFINASIKAFGQRFSLPRERAYAYLKKFSGMLYFVSISFILDSFISGLGSFSVISKSGL